jgi:hypothetical protein
MAGTQPKETAMHSNPDSVLMLADIHHRELQDEA